MYVAPADGRRRRVAVVGRAGTSVLDDLAELDECAGHPWDSDQVSGQVVFEALQQTAGRRAILRDREAFPLFVEAIKAVEPAVAQTVERVAREVDSHTADRPSDVIRRVFGRVLKELADLDNPMRAPKGSEPGDGAVLVPEGVTRREEREPLWTPGGLPPAVGELFLPPSDPVSSEANPDNARPSRSGSTRLPTVAPDATPGEARSRFDPDQGIVFFNDAHGDYLMVKDSEAMLLDYLATLVAKEYVVYNNPRADPSELGEELVRMLVRVRRHLPRRLNCSRHCANPLSSNRGEGGI